MTAFDALSTAIIINDEAIVNQILDYIPSINFTTTPRKFDGVNLVETTGRYLGALLSSYDLLKGPYARLAHNTSNVDALLKQAETLGSSLAFAFQTASGVPQPNLMLNPTPQFGNNRFGVINLNEAGGLILEWTRLADLTGNKTYADLAAACEKHLLYPEGVYQAYPGMVGNQLSVGDGHFLRPYGGWGVNSDVYYEYLIKMYMYDPATFAYNKERWVAAANSTITYLASHPKVRPDLTFLAGVVAGGGQVAETSDHLAAFAGGSFILGGLLLKEQAYVDFGLQLAESYFQVYNQTASGIAPEHWNWVAGDFTQYDRPPPEQEAFYNRTGFWDTDSHYPLRPEVIESLYYAYRATGDVKYQDHAWQAWESINKACGVNGGFSGIKNVSLADGGDKDDIQQGFFLGETLKYLYLIYADDQDVQLKQDGGDYVLNTKAHPLKIREQRNSDDEKKAE